VVQIYIPPIELVIAILTGYMCIDLEKIVRTYIFAMRQLTLGSAQNRKENACPQINTTH
jgi:hypothetical protein